MSNKSYKTIFSFGLLLISISGCNLKQDSKPFSEQFSELKEIVNEYKSLLENNLNKTEINNSDKIVKLSNNILNMEDNISPNIQNDDLKKICQASLEDIFGMTKFFEEGQTSPFGISEGDIKGLKWAFKYAIFSCEERIQVKKINSHALADQYLIMNSIEKDNENTTYESVLVSSEPFNLTLGTKKVAFLKSKLNCDNKMHKMLLINFEQYDSKEEPLSNKQQGTFESLCTNT